MTKQRNLWPSTTITSSGRRAGLFACRTSPCRKDAVSHAVRRPSMPGRNTLGNCGLPLALCFVYKSASRRYIHSVVPSETYKPIPESRPRLQPEASIRAFDGDRYLLLPVPIVFILEGGLFD